MVCIYCGNTTKVTNSRLQKKLNQVWRRRACLNCASIFTTLEAPDLSGSVMFKSDGTLTPFSRDSLFTSIYDSCRHRKTALDDATALARLVIGKLLSSEHAGLIQRNDLIDETLTVLSRFDSTSETFYRAYHPKR